MKEQELDELVKRLEGYNPPDRTLDAQRQISVDIHEAAVAIQSLREQVKGAQKRIEEFTDMLIQTRKEGMEATEKERVKTWLAQEELKSLREQPTPSQDTVEAVIDAIHQAKQKRGATKEDIARAAIAAYQSASSLEARRK